MRNYDYMLEPPDDDDPPEEAYCPHCGECGEYEASVDVDEDTERPYYCGGGDWVCTNRNCPPEQNIDDEEEVEAVQ